MSLIIIGVAFDHYILENSSKVIWSLCLKHCFYMNSVKNLATRWCSQASDCCVCGYGSKSSSES